MLAWPFELSILAGTNNSKQIALASRVLPIPSVLSLVRSICNQLSTLLLNAVTISQRDMRTGHLHEPEDQTQLENYGEELEIW